jgi:GT2 family glycosyltransferase
MSSPPQDQGQTESQDSKLRHPLISVVIPVFNGAATIEGTIASVQGQTIQAIEILVINDGSQDDTLTLVEHLAAADDRIQVISYPNGGLSRSRNRGIGLAKGAFISFIDADDLWHPNKLTAQLRAIEANPRAGVAYSWTDYIDDRDQWVVSGSRIHHNGPVLAALLQGNFLENGSNSLIRTALLKTPHLDPTQDSTQDSTQDPNPAHTSQPIDGFDESLPAAEDWEFHLRLAAQTEFALVPEAHVLYRQGRSTMSANVARQEDASLRVIQAAFAAAPAQFQGLKAKTLGNLYQYLAIRSLHGGPSRQGSGLAGRYWMKALAAQPGLLRTKTKLMAILSLKILSGFLLSDR